MRKENRAAKRQPFRDRVDERRRQLGLGQNDLAAKAHLASAVMSRLMRGARGWRMEHVLGLAGALRVTAAELVEGTDAEGLLDQTVPRAQYERSERDRIEAIQALASARAELKALGAEIEPLRLAVDRPAPRIEPREGDARSPGLPTPLQSSLSALASSFVAAVLDALRGSSLDDLLAESRGGRARPGRTKDARRLKRRSPEDVAKALDAIVAAIKTSETGLRAEQIQERLGMDRKEMPRVLKEGLVTKKLTSTGQRRGTTYFSV